MKKILNTILILFLFYLSVPLMVKGVEAASLKFTNTTYSVAVGADITVGVVVDAGSEQVNSADIYVIYDPKLLEARSVASGSFFPTVTNTITAGKVYIAGLVDDAANSKTGSGTVATITFRGLVASVASLTFDCQTSVYNSSKIIKNDLNATNIITCSANGTSAVTVGSGSTSGTGTGAGAGTSTTLPKSGVFENVVKYAIPGVLLFIIGTVTKLLL